MSHRSIPASLEQSVVEQMRQKKSVRAIAEWLRSAHRLNVSHMAVHRLIERLRLAAFGAPDVDAELADALGEVSGMLRTLRSLSEQFGDLAEKALLGDSEEKVAPNPALADRLLSRQAKLICDWFRYLRQMLKGRMETWEDYRTGLEDQFNAFCKLELTKEKEKARLAIEQFFPHEFRRRRMTVGLDPNPAV